MISAAPPSRRITVGSVRPVSLAVLAAATVWLGLISGYPYGTGVAVAGVAVILAVALRVTAAPTAGALAPVPILFALSLEAATAPVAFETELLAGFAGLAFLVWLADDPSRPAGGAVRGLAVVALPGFALAIAWSSGLFLPAGSVPLGVAGALLALTLAAVALLVSAPELFDREEARS